MATIHSLHLLFIGIFFLVTSQVATFQEQLLSFMLIIGIILVILGIIFRILRAVGLKIKKEFGKTENPKQKFPKNYYLSYFLISLAVIFTLVGLMTMSSTNQEFYVVDLEDATSSYMGKIIPTLDDFRNTLNESQDIETIFFKFGDPHDDIGSGIHIYVYELNDLTEIWIGYTDHILYVHHVDSNGNLLEQLLKLKNET